ncbi:unnamed protein product [Clonostachys chloroleuca]|uniref:Cytochrome P450 n=1 Tax=Clonostachys chloroleuca TaxID=1926264 RepID=A0AA35LQ54_9HYPO|nr:unnamed protein product [Clonostachys chloroleuca]
MAWTGIVGVVGTYFLYLLIAWLFLLFSRRLFLHPFKNIPGPFLAKVTNLYGGIQAIRRRGHLASYENHVKFGPVVRYGPNRLIFNTITAVQDIYANPLVTKSEVYVLTRMTPLGNVFDTPEVDEHRRKRKIISQPISEKAMRDFEPIMAEQIDTFIQQLRKSCRLSEPINMTKRLEYLGGDVVGHLGFGYPLKMQTEETNQWLMWGLSFVNVRVNIYMQFPKLAFIEPALKILGSKIRNKYRSIIGKMIVNRTSMPKDAKRDLYAYAADSMKGGTSLINSELWAEAFFFVVAGGATSATAMAALFFYLTRYPRVYEKLNEEIRTHFQSGEDIHSGKALRDCVYLRACIDEALRMSPPAPGMLWREKIPPKKLADGGKEDPPLVVDGHVIPSGSQVAVNIYALHHNEEYFSDPFKFIPERWLTAEGRDSSSLMRRAFAPFGVGGRSCAGKAVAYLEISLTMAKTLYYFDLEIAPGPQGQIGAGTVGRKDGRGRKDEFQLYDVFTSLHDGPVLKLKERQQAGGE